MKYFKIYILLIFLLGTLHAKSQKAEAWQKLDSTAIMIGDQIGLELGVKVPRNFFVQWPEIGDTLTTHIDVVKKSGIDTIFDNGKMVLKQNLTITSFDSGYFEIPEQHFLFHAPGDTTLYDANTGSVFLQVYVPEVDTTKPFVAIKTPLAEPLTLEEILPWIGGGVLLVAALVLLILYIRKRKQNRPLFGHKPKPLPPPDVEAIEKLENLRNSRMWQSGKVKEYYSELTDIMRRYLERRFGFEAPEMTSDEIIDELKMRKVNPEVMEKLKGMMMLADLVKFAKAQPTPLENDLSLNHAVDFVNETKPAEVEDEKEKEENKVLSDKKEEK